MTQGALGVDVGLSGVRAAVVREDGVLLASARRPYRRARRGSAVAEHVPAEWLEGMVQTGREAAAGAGDAHIAAVGVAALGPAPVLVDERLRPLTSSPLFSLDRRAEPQRRRMTVGLPADEAARTLDNALPKLAWLEETRPAEAARAAWALDATGFLVASLTGVAVMDTITAGDYSLPGCASPFPLPKPLDPVAVAGELRAEAAELLGLPAGLPVVGGTYDSFADIAAAGVRRPGDAGIVLGSTMIVCRAAEAAAPRLGLEVSPYPGEGVLLGGWTLCGGLVLDWCADAMGGERSHAELADAARDGDSGGVVALPYLAGERTPLWDPAARGALLGIGLDTRPEQVYRALVEALALVVRDHTERIAESLGPCPGWRVTGGGTRNRAWLEATADAVGVPLEVVAGASEALGPALLALRGIGHDPVRGSEETIEPDPQRAREAASGLSALRRMPALVAELAR